MRYVSNLIPGRSKILPGYFKGDAYGERKKSLLPGIIMWVLGLFLFVAALLYIKHPLMMLLLLLTGFILIPPGHQWLEKQGRFRLTPTIKTITVLALFVGAAPLANHYKKVDERAAYERRIQDEKDAAAKLIADRKEQQRKDSLAYYIRQSNELRGRQKMEEAGKRLQHASAFASTDTEKEEIKTIQTGIASVKVLALVKAGKYKMALPKIDSLLLADPGNQELKYNRALCYSKTGKTGEAVYELKMLKESGSDEAGRLYEKLNPVRRIIVGYTTLCCDGTTSSARGRGACSWHGGVCNWNHPIYETSRKYK